MTSQKTIDLKEEKEKRDRWEEGIEMMNNLTKLIPILKILGVAVVGVVGVTFAAGVTWILTTSAIKENTSTNESQNELLINHGARLDTIERSGSRVNCKLDVVLSILLEKIEKDEATRKAMNCLK